MNHIKMPRACPVEFPTLVATPTLLTTKLDATVLGRGGSRSRLNSSKHESPRAEPVSSGDWVSILFCSDMKLDATSPWHAGDFLCRPLPCRRHTHCFGASRNQIPVSRFIGSPI